MLRAALFAQNSACLAQFDRALLLSAWEDFLAEKWDGARVLYSLWLYEVWNARIAA